MSSSKLDQLKIEREPEREPRFASWWLVVVILLAVAAGGWWWFRPPAALEVRTGTAQAVSSQAANTVLNASGYVTARRQATVSSKFTAQVLEVLIEEGMEVAQGDVLARLDDANVRTSFELADAQLQAARTSLKETEALLVEARANLERSQTLVERQLASQSELDRNQAAASALAARLERVAADVVVAQRQRDIYQQQLDDTVIRAPFAGVVVAKNAQPGEMISPVSAGGGFTRTGIGTIVDMSSLEVEIDVNEAYINRVKPDQPVVATLDAYPDWHIPAHVIAIIPTADRQRATVGVRVGFDALDARILPDMGVKVAFQEIAGEQPAASAGVLVPGSAIRDDGGRAVVWLVHEGVAERRAVAVGGERDDAVLVTAGLSGGERVILNHPAGLQEGVRVTDAP